MYKLLLILRYLRRKLAPLFAALAVTLCTAMVIIVISIMGGFLQMMRSAAKTLTGDVIVQADLNGFPHYEKLIERVEARPEIDAAAPVIRSYGLANIAGQNYTVEVEGIDPLRMDKVTSLRERMHWSSSQLLQNMGLSEYDKQYMSPESRTFVQRMEAELTATDLTEFGMRMRSPDTWGDAPAMVPGIAVSQFNVRDENGEYDIKWSLVERKVGLTVLRISNRGQPVEPATAEFVVVNEFKSGLYEVDAKRIYVGFDQLQQMLRMDGYTQRPIDPQTGEYLEDAELITVPGRASEVTIRAATSMTRDGVTVPVTLEMAKQAVQEEVDRLAAEQPDIAYLRVMTWEQRHGTFLGAVQKEKMLLTILFAIISIVAIAMIGVIFYMIVLEKTRDIGILRAVGALRGGIMGIFVGYGLAIGIVGAGMGLLLATLVVLNINEIQDWLATDLGSALFYVACVLGGTIVGGVLGVTVGVVSGRMRERVGLWLAGGAAVLASVGFASALVILRTMPAFNADLNARLGFRMWDPRIYYFDKIPSQLDSTEVAVIVAVAILSSVLGSVVPAILASLVDPVESLRYE